MDGFFASAEQHLRPELRGCPVAVHAGTPEHRVGTLISVSREAKAKGIKSGMRSREARRELPSLVVLAQRPVEYNRLHHALVACIDEVAPVHEVHSVDEVSIALSPSDDPPLPHPVQAALRRLGIDVLQFKLDDEQAYSPRASSARGFRGS